MITIVGAVFSLFIVVFATVRRDLLPWLLSAAMPFTATASFIVAGQSIVAYYVVALVIIVLGVVGVTLRGLLALDLSSKPGLLVMVAFGTWAVVITVVGPIIFSGLAVLNPRDGIDQGIRDPATLSPQISNFAQATYLIIGIATVIVVGGVRNLSPRLPALGFAMGTVLSSLKLMLPPELQRSLFDNSTNVAYTAGTFNGIERMRGIFSEPAALGGFSTASMVFFLLTASSLRGSPRTLCLAMSAWAFTNTVLSFSGGAVVSGLAILAVLFIVAIRKYVAGRSSVSGTGLFASLMIIPFGILFGPLAYGFVTLIQDDKTGSSSFANRSAADSFSMVLSTQSFGLGVGLGSNRPSSFFAMLLSCTGVLGTALFLLAVSAIVIGALRAGVMYSPSVWALFALLIGKVVSGPDLSDPLMWLLIAVCANASWRLDPDSSKLDDSPRQQPVDPALGSAGRSI